jgi:hypothetical protein
MDIGILLLIVIVICFVVNLVTGWPKGYNPGTVASAIGLVLSLVLLFKPV